MSSACSILSAKKHATISHFMITKAHSSVVSVLYTLRQKARHNKSLRIYFRMVK